MPSSSDAEVLRNANIRLCKLRVWREFDGLGFNLEAAQRPPHLIRLVESNSPASAGGLKILDVILYVNQEDVSEADYNTVRGAIKTARDSNRPIELIVVEQRFYQLLKKKNIKVTPQLATNVIQTPESMPADYINFPKRIPRTCNLRLGQSDTFGFEVINGENDIGAYIQEVFPNTPASNTPLRKCDRIIEIDDKNVDKDVSKSILEKLAKAKQKGSVKLFVVDTDTYKNAQLHKLPLTSKGKRKSQSEDRQSTSRYNTDDRSSLSNNDGNQLTPSNPSTLRGEMPKTRTPSVPDLTPSTRSKIPPLTIPPSVGLPNEDIRLCTIYRADPSDTFGIELNYHRREQFHSLSIVPGRNNERSNAEQAGIKTDDRLIEINGQNIQNLSHDQITQRIRAVKHPDPLVVLVSDVPTFEHYKQQQKLIHRGLPNVKIMPSNRRTPSASPASSIHHSPGPRTPSIAQRDPPNIQTVPPPLNSFGRTPTTSVLGDLTNNVNSSLPPPSVSSSQPRHIPIRKDAQLSNGVGFNFRTVPNDSSSSSTPYSHIVTSVDGTNSIGTQGLRVNDFILSINDENVEYLNHEQLEDKLRRINNSETVRFLVADGSVYRAYKQTSQNLKPKYDLVEQPKLTPNANLQQSRRQYRLQRNPDFEGYGFRVRSNQTADATPRQIVSVEPYSPADVQGLRVGDYILRVNNQTVEHMSPAEFTSLMQTLVRNDTTRDGALLLEVMDEETYRSLNSLSPPSLHQYQPALETLASDRRTPTRTTYDVYQPSTLGDDVYPKMRQCFIRPWPNYRDLGFAIVPAQNTTGGGYQIQQLRLDSPAAHTHIRNGDHLVQVNNINVETTDYQYVYQLINDSYRRDGEVSLLVIDDIGYQWYKRNHYRIDPLSQRANVSRHITPEHQAVYTSTDSSVISPPMHYAPVEAMPDHRETHIPPAPIPISRPPSVGPSTRPYPYTNGGYVSPARDPYNRPVVAPSVTSSLSRPRMPLSRAAVDVVDEKSMLRFCRLNTEPGQTFGFELAQEDDKHVIRNVKPDSPAARAGLHNEDRLIEVNDENVTRKTHRDVVALIKTASNNGVARLLISPSNIKPLNKPSSKSAKTKSLPSLNDERIYNDGRNFDQYGAWSPYDVSFGGPQQPPNMVKYLSTSRLDHVGTSPGMHSDRPYSANGFDTYQRQPFRSTFFASQSYLPTEPWPRKCILIRDPGFHGCGFRMIEKENYDTPIVIEVRQNSPAKRSGLTEGDHIIYIENRNVQAIRSFDEMTLLIQRTFEETGQVTLVTLTAPGYQVLKRKGGYLQPEPFDYQMPYIRELAPRLCRIILYNHEQDFGFTLQRGNPVNIKDVHPGSPAYEFGLRANDKIIELNGHDTATLSSEQIIETIETSKRRRQLDILVIDSAGFEFSIKHAVPINSLLPFVQPGQRRAVSSRRAQQEAVYL
ncbi:unnamed protein product [Rotaria socialis]|uniref:PDZ domain-containing protein n=1 Tax=Rotaria socialis TaxID=392032 RepID=A0A818KEF2_9BILA|nr:unnamed protein product [Rotaria socialis]CAF3383331.1 unnamed protein product [Rotaria socialis]CAF3560411.1 unnamed protein product [Rotaria socialis]CAF3699923.1 unnamed protein product [Rotaria socialis]CAF3701426.1 unnamed protein product [Rotaria socialis]